jgi:hypothetical protein
VAPVDAIAEAIDHAENEAGLGTDDGAQPGS